jgi:hypothetical protein
MTKIRVNKIEAARRQIDAAIRMLFSNEDSIAIHTLAMASFRIVRDLSEKRKENNMHKRIKSIFKPGMEKEFWKELQVPANFLKHADNDPDGILENIKDEANEWVLFIACLYYKDLGFQYTPEMTVLVTWYFVLHPEYLRKEVFQIKQLLVEAGSDIKGLKRIDQLAFCKQLLQRMKPVTV